MSPVKGWTSCDYSSESTQQGGASQDWTCILSGIFYLVPHVCFLCLICCGSCLYFFRSIRTCIIPAMGLASSRESGRSGDILMVQLPLIDTYREFRDYVQWLKGNYVPTEAKLRSMVESGFVFPETCKAILKPMEVNILKPVVKLKGIQFLMMSIPSAGLSPVPFFYQNPNFPPFFQSQAWMQVWDFFLEAVKSGCCSPIW